MEIRELIAIFQSSDQIISYSPIGDEPDPGLFLKANRLGGRGVSILPIIDQSPEAAAHSFTKRYTGEKVSILIPGREFDRKGTRHGRGGGWYDRFLAAVPKDWFRVGVVAKGRLSEAPLVQEAHDQPMDALLVWDEKGRWDMMATDARS